MPDALVQADAFGRIVVEPFGADALLPMLAQAEASRLAAAAYLAAFPAYYKGDPGGNAMAVGFRMAGSTFNIPTGTDLIQTSGFAMTGVGQALYAATTDTGITPYRFQSSNGRWFKLVAVVLTPQHFGAIGDGTLHLLSERFGTLAAAQQFYPFVTSLSQTIDYAAIQSALNYIENNGRLTIPIGHYRIGTDSLVIANYCEVEGLSRGGDDLGFGALIESDSTTAPILTNKYTANVAYLQIRDVALRGGGFGINFQNATSISFLVLERIDTRNCAIDDIRLNRLEVSIIRDCSIMSGSRSGYAINITGFADNGNVFDFNRFSCAGSGMFRAGQGSDGIRFRGGSIEGGGQLGAAVFDLDGTVVPVRAIFVDGVYIENGSQFLIRLRGLCENIKFGGNCKINGAASSGGLVPFQFDVGNILIEFGSNAWNEGTVGPTIAPANILLQGINGGLNGEASNVYTSMTRESFAVNLRGRDYTGSPTLALATLLRASVSNDPSNQIIATATWTITAQGMKGSTPVDLTVTYRVAYVAAPGGGFQIRYISTDTAASPGGTPTFTPGFNPASTSATLTLAVNGFDTLHLSGSAVFRCNGTGGNVISAVLA